MSICRVSRKPQSTIEFTHVHHVYCIHIGLILKEMTSFQEMGYSVSSELFRNGPTAMKGKLALKALPDHLQ